MAIYAGQLRQVVHFSAAIMAHYSAAIDRSTPGISVRDKKGRTLAGWDSRSAHGLWVDSQDGVYSALTGAQSVDKYIDR